MSKPAVRLEVNGRPFGADAFGLIRSVTIEDREGDRADSLQISLLDGPEVGWVAIPASDALIKVWLGYRGDGGEAEALPYFGAFSDADATVEILPYGLSISAKAADLTQDLKRHQERHWDGRTVGQVLEQLAAENGLSPAIAERFAAQRFPRDYAAMQGESVLHFGRRVADRLGGLFAVKDGRLILAEKASGKSSGGLDLPPILITRSMIQKTSCSVTLSAREKVAKVEAEHHDQAAAVRRTETAKTPGAAEGAPGGAYRLRGSYGDAAEARAAAEAKASALAASADRLDLTIEGAPAARAGTPLILSGVRPGLDGIVWIIESATHTLAKGQGYTTAISAKRKPEQGQQGGGQEGGQDQGEAPAPEVNPLEFAP